ncbi:hypothetical protein ACJJTC_006218 [Scirpophaga incertulas]
MMQKILVILFCACIIAKSVNAAVSILPPQEKPPELADLKGCYIPELNGVLDPNVPFSPDAAEAGCKQYICRDNGWTEIYTCGAVDATHPCSIVDGDMEAAYPDCCPTIKCPPEKSN